MKISSLLLAISCVLQLKKGCGFLPMSRHNPLSKQSLKLSKENEPVKTQSSYERNEEFKPDILLPYKPAADPMFSVRGEVGNGDFVVSREGEPRPEELANENILKIVKIKCSDLEVNTLVWKCLGYRFDAENERWDSTKCFPKWKEAYPSPPDFIGMQRIYEKEVDQPSLRSNQALVKSIPAGNKQSLKEHMKPLGWKGYQYKELTPNKTRRAQCANWLVFYREELYGYTVEELRERRRLKQEAAKAEGEAGAKKEGDNGWKLPVKEVY